MSHRSLVGERPLLTMPRSRPMSYVSRSSGPQSESGSGPSGSCFSTYHRGVWLLVGRLVPIAVARTGLSRACAIVGVVGGAGVERLLGLVLLVLLLFRAGGLALTCCNRILWGRRRHDINWDACVSKRMALGRLLRGVGRVAGAVLPGSISTWAGLAPGSGTGSLGGKCGSFLGASAYWPGAGVRRVGGSLTLGTEYIALRSGAGIFAGFLPFLPHIFPPSPSQSSMLSTRMSPVAFTECCEAD